MLTDKNQAVVDALREWNLFYSVLAGSTATLFGLLFFAVTLNASALNRSEHAKLLRLAGLTFSNFFLIFMLSMQMLIPTTLDKSVRARWVICSLLGLGWTIRLYLDSRKAPEAKMHGSLINRSYRLSIMAYVLGFGFASISIGPLWATLQLLLIPIMMLLGSSIRNSWGLMTLINTTDDDSSEV